MKKIIMLFLIAIIFLNQHITYANPPQDIDQNAGSGGIAITDQQNSGSSAYPTSFNTPFQAQGQTAPQPPPNPIQIAGSLIKDYSSLSVSGNSISFSSASYAKSSSFNFNNIGSSNLNINNGVLNSATVTSSVNNNVLTINNPLDEAAKINIYLNASQTMTYSYANDKVEISFPQQSYINISKGSKSILVQPNSANSKLTIQKSKITVSEADLNKNVVYSDSYLTIRKTDTNNANYGFEGDKQVYLNGVITYKRFQSFDQLKSVYGTYPNYLQAASEFLLAYKSSSQTNRYKITSQNEVYNAELNYPTLQNTIFTVQNFGYHRLVLESKQNAKYAAYYRSTNTQNCPNYNYLSKSTELNANENTYGEVIYRNTTLQFKNYVVYTENSNEFKKIETKIKNAIVAQNPEHFAGVDIE